MDDIHFSNIHTENKTMRRVLETAREYSLSDSPVLIFGETGTEYYQISEAIHNNSIRKGGPFVSVNITEGGYAQLAQFSWQGNKLQLKAFLERLVLTADKRSIAEGTIRTLFGELYPYVGEVGGEEKLVVYKTEEAVKISELLKKHRGNRKLAAEELGISTTTRHSALSRLL